MINVTINRHDNQIKQFELTGHAESGPYGYDLVCAAVSAVSFGSVNAVMALSEEELKVEQGDEGGFLRVTVPETMAGEALEKAQLLFEGMLISLKTIEQEYNAFITIYDR